MSDVEITGYVPGAIGRIVEMHAVYYARHWDLGRYFEARVAWEMGELMGRFDPEQDGAWFARVDERIVGAVLIDGHDRDGEGARLRWFIVDPDYQGLGLGHRLMTEAMTFCRRQGFRRVYLTTFAGLHTARHVYEKFGFRLCREEDGTELTGSPNLIEQVFECQMVEETGESA